MQHDQCLIVFAGAIQAQGGRPRLVRELGLNFCAELYRYFLSDTLTAMKDGSFAVEVLYPPDSEKNIKALCPGPVGFYPQHGDDSGEKLANAFADCFGRAFQSVIWIDSNCPDLPRAIVEEAFFALAGDEHDAVIGPAVNRGYYLIGFNRDSFSPDIFYGLSGSGEALLEETMDFMRNRGYRVKTIARWQEISDRGALAKLIDRNAGSASDASGTMAYLKSKKISSGWQILDPRFAVS